MKCAQCNSTLVDQSKFCSECGAEVQKAEIHADDESAAAPVTNGQAVKQYAVEVAQEAGELSKTALRSDLGKKIAAGAAIGAVVAVPVPFIGPMVGAAVGAGIVAIKRLTK